MSGASRIISGEVALSDLKGKAIENLLAKKMNNSNEYVKGELKQGKNVIHSHENK